MNLRSNLIVRCCVELLLEKSAESLDQLLDRRTSALAFCEQSSRCRGSRLNCFGTSDPLAHVRFGTSDRLDPCGQSGLQLNSTCWVKLRRTSNLIEKRLQSDLRSGRITRGSSTAQLGDHLSLKGLSRNTPHFCVFRKEISSGSQLTERVIRRRCRSKAVLRNRC